MERMSDTCTDRGLLSKPYGVANLTYPTYRLRYNPFAMPRRKAPEDMSVEELRRLLIEKRRGARRERLEHFKRTGRVVDVAPDILAESTSVVDTLEETTDQPQVPVSKRRRVMDRFLLAV